MRGGRSFLILLVVALGLGGYIYFVESKREPASSPATKKDKVFTADSSKFEEVEVHAVSGDVTTLKKVNGLWEIVASRRRCRPIRARSASLAEHARVRSKSSG